MKANKIIKEKNKIRLNNINDKFHYKVNKYNAILSNLLFIKQKNHDNVIYVIMVKKIMKKSAGFF